MVRIFEVDEENEATKLIQRQILRRANEKQDERKDKEKRERDRDRLKREGEEEEEAERGQHKTSSVTDSKEREGKREDSD